MRTPAQIVADIERLNRDITEAKNAILDSPDDNVIKSRIAKSKLMKADLEKELDKSIDFYTNVV